MAISHRDAIPKDFSIQEQGPENEYSRRLGELRALEAHQKRQDSGFVYLISFLLLAAFCTATWILVNRAHRIGWVLLPPFLLVFCMFLHDRVLRALRITSRVIAFYNRGIERLEGLWPGKGKSGERFSDPSHPYSRDLDLFGNGSVYELLCNARTLAGEETLAKWLLVPATPGEVQSRHAAVVELRDRLELREQLAVLGDDIRHTAKPESLATWGEKAPLFDSRFGRVSLAVLSVSIVFSSVLWAAWDIKSVFFVLVLINLSITYKFRTRQRESTLSIEAAASDLRILSQVLTRLEREQFSAPKLLALQAAFRSNGLTASRLITRLNRHVEWLSSRRSFIVSSVGPFVFWTLQWCFAVEAWRKEYGRCVRCWLDAVGELEALSDLAGYAFEHPSDAFPEFIQDGSLFEAVELAHPLIPEVRAIRNDLTLNHDFQLMIISGPNMAGKSTLVRAIGVNAVLAQCGAPVRALRLRLSPLAVGASVCVLDSLQGGISRFYAEIARLKLIVDLTRGPIPVLFLLDELLQGTNSHDRRIGAEAVARNLVARGAVGVLTTHDLALAEIAESRQLRAGNFHFEDHLENGQLRFDYRLCPGIVRTSNALDLMRSIGLDI